MPDPLTIKRPKTASPVMQVLIGVVIIGPLLGLSYCWRRKLDIHFDDPVLNLSAHLLLVIVPLIWVALIVYKPLSFEQSAGETRLCYTTYFSALSADWWMSLMMWAAPLFALGAVGYDFFTKHLPNPEDLSTNAVNAVFTIIVTFVLGLTYGTIVRERPETRVSDAGMRTGVLHFYEWENIHHVAQWGAIYSFFHRANPALPVSSFRLKDWEARTTFERFLAQHNVPVSNRPHPLFVAVKVAVVFGFLLTLALAIGLRLKTSLDLRWIIAIAYAVGILLTLPLERLRGAGSDRPSVVSQCSQGHRGLEESSHPGIQLQTS